MGSSGGRCFGETLAINSAQMGSALDKEGAILGCLAFIREARSKLKDGILRRQELSHTRSSRDSSGSDEIIEAIFCEFKVCGDEVLRPTEDSGQSEKRTHHRKNESRPSEAVRPLLRADPFHEPSTFPFSFLGIIVRTGILIFG